MKEERLKIAHVITRLIIGGAQENTVATVKGLQEDAAYDCHLISGSEKGPEGRLELSGLQNLVFIPSLVRRIQPLWDLVTLVRLVALFRREQYQVVHTHSSKAGIIGRLAAKLAGVPIIIHTIHGLPFFPYQGHLKNKCYIELERLAARWTHRIIVVAPAMQRQALAEKIGSEEKYRVVYSGMNLDPYLQASHFRESFRKQWAIDPEALVIGKIARFFPLKGHDFFFDAACELLQQFPNVKFLLVGDGILLQDFKNLIQNRGLSDSFCFTGLTKPEQVPEALGAMDILVHTSLREGLPRVLPQAMAAGVVPVAFALDGSPDLIQDGLNGCLVAPEDRGELLQTLKHLIQESEPRLKLSRAGVDAVDPLFRNETMVSALKELYREFL